jgi:hypothetical protein
MKSETKKCQSCLQEFVIEPDDFSFYEKMKVPPPTWCPACRMIRRMAFRNERAFFRNTDQISKKEVFSGIPPQSAYKIYDRDYWYSDSWDAAEYAREYDFSKPFFEQFHEFAKAVPWPSRSILNLVNADYSNNASDLKNAYLCFNATGVENSAYVVGAVEVKEGFDLFSARHTELAYENYMSDESYRVFFSVNAEDCHDVWFSRNLIGCQNCFGCVNLRNKSYYIFNEPHTKESYQEFMAKFRSGSAHEVEEMKKKAHAFWREHPMRFTLAINNVSSTGEHIEHSKNVKESYAIHESENLKFCQDLESAYDSYDHTVWGMKTSLVYETCVTGVEATNVKFSYSTYSGVQNIEYSMWCTSSSNLFGCVGLKKKQYCIFNKQYTKEAYEALRAKIIDHMNAMPYTDKQGRVYKYGEFFPPEFSPFAYNETIAQDFFPLTKETAEAKGYLWREPEAKNFATTINAGDLPDAIGDVKDDILKHVIKCLGCGKAYRIIEMELAFYRRISLPLPRRCPECRFKKRFEFVNPPKFWHSKCHCTGETNDLKLITGNEYRNTAKHFHGSDPCPNEFETSYAPDRPEIIYCEKCYQAEVV